MTPQQVENLKIGAAVVATGLVIYYVFGNKNPNGTPDPEVNGDTPTTFNAKNVADGLYDAMNRLGTDDNAVIEILKTVSPGQFMLVSKAFGLKLYNTWTGNDFGLFLNSLPLKTWLKNEVSAADYAILKSKYPNQL